MYKPHTIEQYKVYRFLEENFALEHFLLAPLSRFGLMLEDKTGEKSRLPFSMTVYRKYLYQLQLLQKQ